MNDGEDSDIDHGASQSVFDDAIAHAHDEQQEEREGVTAGVEDGDDYEKQFVNGVVAVTILVVVEAPCHELLDDEEDDGCSECSSARPKCQNGFESIGRPRRCRGRRR